ncbi:MULTISPECIES: 16S rRNA (guanine(527)-N(7))-methyltransferase RsmG [Enterococcus]|uniref:Ribosomal RNA small subunit methyltransferase G n=1 Tax=Enterococcus malodoratus ATCC 43197 TaxID=1158601 RepID=R2NJD4_9ENTE|nr:MULTISPECIES: 16S rRNA (guanine(527)-N(7))-methyltransferase RsmG [Enterococcus]BBM16435.1 ribosomal RNA small subunit methyltransferase G [Enterococcus avium]EOH72187.1 16S rRNA (guanine(527)-N(7))-methyltransferase GidB [Enterococcus malodoratus ATCC 43197]EOT70488.1 16S rRNA (guanine(527)-N(7))-methyltransferase GidB [Enterococcus malodoratus ATCC 43197]OJG64294.1 16S rRNA (guanine(527)-N(7))-methyltransferase GidB [Enterococcus malodoratus]SET21666.1 16S rRNA (guanine527-N7)-methyltrans
MTPEEFQKELGRQGIKISARQMDQFATYFRLLVEWNQKMNLTAITEHEEVYLKHFYDSITLAFSDTFKPEGKLCDVGSGAGFPSLPLKIVFPELEVTIVDSLNKRVTFLTVLVETLQLDGVHLYHDRAETFGQNPKFREAFDFVTARAVARLNVLTELCLPLVKSDGYFFALKAAKSEEELIEARPAIALLGGKLIEAEDVSLPNGDTRHIITVQKKKETPKKYPRKPGLPNKQPLR